MNPVKLIVSFLNEIILNQKNKKKCPCSVNCTAVLHCKERTCNTIPQNCHVVKRKSIGGIFLYSNNNNYIRMMIMMVVWKHYIRSGLYINNFLTSVRSVFVFISWHIDMRWAVLRLPAVSFFFKHKAECCFPEPSHWEMCLFLSKFKTEKCLNSLKWPSFCCWLILTFPERMK